MLVLTRKRDERVFIEVEGLEGPIEVMLVDCGNGRARIGFTHPNFDKVRFYRNEIYGRVLEGRETPEREDLSCPPAPSSPIS